MTKRLTGVAALVLLPAVALAACARPSGPGSPGSPADIAEPPPSATAEDRNLVEDGYAGRYRVTTTVLESPKHGPQLCAAVAESLPPQCGGPDIVGWDWKAVRAESVNGTTWGEYTVVGTWNEAKSEFTLTQPPTGPGRAPDSSLDSGSPFRSPCPTPAGGWRPVDPALANQDAQDRVLSLARSDPDFGGAWLDQSYLDREPGATQAADANDPLRLVLNVSFTRDLRSHEAELRKVWGGALCVSKARRSMAQLEDVRARVEPGLTRMISTSIGELTNTLDVSVWIATERQQREYDARYGEGTVVLDGWFDPID